MPPWDVEKNVGIQKYKNDPSLSDLELAKIAKWADSGASEGNPADLPPARTFDAVEREFSASARSFRSLSRAEAESIRPNRIDLYTVRPNDTWSSIACAEMPKKARSETRSEAM